MIRQCENSIKQIDQAARSHQESICEAQIRKNVKASLAQQISDATISLRKSQKLIYDQMKQTGPSSSDQCLFDEQDTENSNEEDEQQQQQQQQQQSNILYKEIIENREKDINRLVDQINELASIYKTLGVLVIDQGTLLDRIDCNICTTKENVLKSKKHLVQAVKVEESKFASKVIQILIGLIIVFSVFLVLKFTV